MNKSKAAYLLSCRALFATNSEVFMYMFNHRDVVGDDISVQRWHHFRVLLMQRYPNCRGLRVVEVHPGDDATPSHGLHYHLLIDTKLSRKWLFKASVRAGFGISKAANKGNAVDSGTAEYLAKYLSKDSDKIAGCRKWGRLGKGWGVRVKDIVVDYVLARNMRAVAQVIAPRRLTADLISHIAVQSAKHGSILAWPIEGKEFVPFKMPDPVDLPDTTNDSELPPASLVRFREVRVRVAELANEHGFDDWCTVLVKARDVVEPF